MYENHPLYYGKNIVRFEQFLSDLNDLMTDKFNKYSVTEALAILIDKYELRNSAYFNNDSYNFLFYVISTYYKKYIINVNEKKASVGSEETDLSLLRNLGKG